MNLLQKELYIDPETVVTDGTGVRSQLHACPGGPGATILGRGSRRGIMRGAAVFQAASGRAHPGSDTLNGGVMQQFRRFRDPCPMSNSQAGTVVAVHTALAMTGAAINAMMCVTT